MKSCCFFGLLFVLIQHGLCQTMVISADRMIDVRNGKVIQQPVIVVEGNRILKIGSSGDTYSDSTKIIKLTGCTLLPGLMDMHTHVLSDGTEGDDEHYRHSSAYRALRAAKHLQISLLNGFTTLREMCSEGAGYADVDLRRGVDSGFIIGPRLFVSGPGLAATGSYLPRPRKQNWELDLPAATKYVSGVSECLQEVRRQENNGINWLKIFSDWGNEATFSTDELNTMVGEATRYGVPVAAHAKSVAGIRNSLSAGVKSIEHGNQFNDSLIKAAVQKRVFWCPTLTWEEYHHRDTPGKYKALNSARAARLKVVCGSDVGGFPWSVNQVRELELLVEKAGFSPIEAIQTATINAAELLGKQHELGWLQSGFLADIIAVRGDPSVSISTLRQVVFVMKDGRVYKSGQW